VDKRLSRWLLMTHDHAPGDEFEMKHEFMAMMLGVTRSVVTRAAGHLQKEELIRYTRGRVTVLDRKRLEATACECYGVVKSREPATIRGSHTFDKLKRTRGELSEIKSPGATHVAPVTLWSQVSRQLKMELNVPAADDA
jgi:hypothetical protein